MSAYFTASLASVILPLTGAETIPCDTNLSGGRSPQSEAITVDNISGYGRADVALTDATSITTDIQTINRGLGTVTLGGNRTLANPTNMVAGTMYKWDIVVTQDGTGNRTLAYGSAYLKVGGTVTLSTAASAVDTLHFLSDGTTIYVTIDKAFA